MAWEDFSLDLNLDQTGLGGKGRERKTKRERERKERDFRERISTFSLGFPVIGPLVSGEARSKVAPHGKGYAWVPVLGSFKKLQKVGVFSYLYYSLAKGHFNGWGFVKAWMTVFSATKDLD